METQDREEQLLRSVALQNANSILLARQRAESELLRTKEALERKTDELARSLAALRAVLESTTDGILVTDHDGRVTDYNARFVEMWQIPSQLIEPREHRRLLGHTRKLFKDPEAFVERIDQIYATSPPDTYDLLELASGRTIERFSRIQIVEQRNIGRVWTFREVTERRRSEEAVSRLAAVVESSDDAIVSKTLDGVIRTWNRGAEVMFGYSAEEIVGRPVRVLIPPDRSDEELRILERLRRGERIERYETVRRRKDGTLLDVELTVSPVRGANGQIIGASKIARDITDRKKAAAEREYLLDAERAARAEVGRVSLLKDQFLANVSHELRSPLSAIILWSQILSRGKSSPEDLDEGLDVIARSARVQARLIEDLLDMSRIVAGKVRLDVQQTDLATVVEQAVSIVRPAAEAKGIRLRPIVDPSAGPVSGDPNRLQQVVWNLLSNAVKFTPRGGNVEVVLQRANSHVEIAVSDSGRGISPDFLPHVFERFRQADTSKDRAQGGLGLGLAIAKQTVELHGGTVIAHSPGEGKGATFTVSLPLAPVRRREGREHPTAPTGRILDGLKFDLSGVSILVVEDEADARQLLQRVLADCKADVRVAANATEALELMKAERFDVLVSDLGMPKIDGDQFIREVRRLSPQEGGSVPAIALTAFARSEDRTRAMMAGYQMHIAKPIEIHELLATVASFAGRTRPDE